MNLPGFNAESSLGPTIGRYRGKAVFGGSNPIDVLPMQDMLGSSMLSQYRFFPPPWFVVTTRCCQYSKYLGRIVCVSRVHSPIQQCQCIRSSSNPPPGVPDFPVIICHDPVLSQF